MGNKLSIVVQSDNDYVPQNDTTTKIIKGAKKDQRRGSMIGNLARFLGAFNSGRNQVVPEDMTSDTSDGHAIQESFVNPMKSILTDQSSGAFIPWSHVSKVIAALDIVIRELRVNDDEMNEIMLQQCVHLLRESPYTLKLNNDISSTPMAATKGTAHAEISMSLRDINVQSYGQATVEVTNWISKMVNLHLEVPTNLDDLPDTEDELDSDHVDYDKIYGDDDDKDGFPNSLRSPKGSGSGRDGDNELGLRRQNSFPLTLRNSAVGALSDDIKRALKEVKEWNFDCFSFFELCGDFSLSIVGVHLLKQTGMLSRLKVNEAVLAKFLHTIQSTYKEEIPYHNAVHAADVCVSLHSLMSSRRFSNSNANRANPKYTCRLKERLIFRADEILTAYVAALCHDVGHPGFNNAFHVNSESDLAILYNDQSVLENFHIATTYRVLKFEGNNFTKQSKIDCKRMRKLMTHLILHTDMAFHTRVVDHIQLLKETKIVRDEEEEFAKQQSILQQRGVTLPTGKRIKLKGSIPKLGRKRKSLQRQASLNKLKSIGENEVDSSKAVPDVDIHIAVGARKPAMSIMDEEEQGVYEQDGFDESKEWSESDKFDFLSGLMHACDISNPCKDKPLMLKWSLKLYTEFYNQGDREKEMGLPVSEICDRNKPKRAIASIGFANFIVKPLFEGLKPFFKISDLALITLDKNTKYWETKADEQASFDSDNSSDCRPDASCS